jgi:hypothetical protein
MESASRQRSPLLRLLPVAAAFAACGCATVSGTPTQPVSVQAVDASGRPVDGMRCRLANGAADYFGTTPIFDLQVRRSASDLQVECRRGGLLARGTAVSRGTHLGRYVAAALLPGGTAAVLIDHLSGYGYAYPARIRLRVGEHLVFDGGSESPRRDSLELAFDTHR